VISDKNLKLFGFGENDASPVIAMHANGQ